MVEPLISFKVKRLPLPKNVSYEGLISFPPIKENEEWYVVGCRPNPLPRWGSGSPGYVEPFFREEPWDWTTDRPISGETRQLSSLLFLLIEKGKVPIWWPSEFVEVLDEIR